MPSAIRFTAFFALVAQVLGLAFTNSNMGMSEGVPITLTWSEGQVGMVTIRLMTGDSDSLKTVEWLTTSGKDESFTWTPPSDIPSGTYAFAIEDESSDEVNYSASFEYDGDKEVSSASATVTDSTTITAATINATSTMTASNSTITTSTSTGNFTLTSMSTAKTTTAVSTTSLNSESTEPASLNGDEPDSAGVRSGVSLFALIGMIGAFALA